MIDEKAYNKAVAMNLRRIMYEKGITQVEPARSRLISLQNRHPFQITFQFQ